MNQVIRVYPLVGDVLEVRVRFAGAGSGQTPTDISDGIAQQQLLNLLRLYPQNLMRRPPEILASS